MAVSCSQYLRESWSLARRSSSSEQWRRRPSDCSQPRGSLPPPLSCVARHYRFTPNLVPDRLSVLAIFRSPPQAIGVNVSRPLSWHRLRAFFGDRGRPTGTLLTSRGVHIDGIPLHSELSVLPTQGLFQSFPSPTKLISR